MTARSSSVSLPHFSFTLPANCFQLPSTRSQFMARSFRCCLASAAIIAQRERKKPGCCIDSPLRRRPKAPHRGQPPSVMALAWPELFVSMLKDDIVSLLPDLRAFARFMCREREAADDLVQNTILAALDKQAQFEPGTNLKGWLFTIMRNRFYSDLRAQRRRPTGIEDVGATP